MCKTLSVQNNIFSVLPLHILRYIHGETYFLDYPTLHLTSRCISPNWVLVKAGEEISMLVMISSFHVKWREESYQDFLVLIKVSESCSVVSSLLRSHGPHTVHGIPQARILEWIAYPFFWDLPDPGIKPGSPALEADSLPAELPGKPILIKKPPKYQVPLF